MNNNTFISYFIILTIASLITGCSNKHVSTNLDKNNFINYFSPATVKIYQQESEIKVQHHFIGIVEGQDCQIKPHHAAPDEIIARTQARLQAFNKQANGVVFTGCVLLTPQQLAKLNKSSEAQQCHSIVICYAKAFIVEPSAEN